MDRAGWETARPFSVRCKMIGEGYEIVFDAQAPKGRRIVKIGQAETKAETQEVTPVVFAKRGRPRKGS